MLNLTGKLILTTILASLALAAYAKAELTYPFDSAKKQEQFQRLTQEIRCLVCQNQSLNDSNAPLAKDLRNEIYTKIQAGESDEQIKHYLTLRYSDFILFNPPFNQRTWILWLTPLITFLIGLSILIRLHLKKTK